MAMSDIEWVLMVFRGIGNRDKDLAIRRCTHLSQLRVQVSEFSFRPATDVTTNGVNPYFETVLVAAAPGLT
jgi:hypothetical protein